MTEDEFRYSYNVLKFDLSAGLTDLEVPIHAERIDYVSPTDGPELSIRLQRKSNDGLPLRPNGSIEAPFTRIFISAAVAAKTVYLMVGAPSSVRVTGRDVAVSGFISVQDYRNYLANLGQLYERTLTNSSGAGVTAGLQLINPAASGKTLEVLSVGYSGDVAGTLVQFGKANTNYLNATGGGTNMKIGLADSTTIFRWSAVAVLDAITRQANVLANTHIEIPMSVVLTPGNGCALTAFNAGAHVDRFTFLFREY